MARSRVGRGRFSLRGLAVVIACAALLAAAVPSARAQGQAALAPPHSDYGVDFDGDGGFNVLRINVSLSVTIGGWFFVAVDLYDGTGMNYITGSYWEGTLLAGPAVVRVDLPGLDIRNAGIDGPYQASIAVYDDFFNLDDAGIHITQAYMWAAFEMPGLLFSPPHADAGVDTDADMLFDVLRVTWSVNVLEAGTYDFSVDLYAGFTYFDSTWVSLPLATGPQTVDTDFIGWRINANGVDGPYDAYAYAYDAAGSFVGTDSHTTAAYLWTQFEAPPIRFTPPHADGVEDTDGDSLFNVLYVNWSVDVSVAGNYQFSVTLYDSTFNWIAQVGSWENLSSGPQVATTAIPGWQIRTSGYDGPYTAFVDAYNDTGDSIGSSAHTTAAYGWIDFETPPAALNPPHADAGVDTDGDMLFDRIDIQVNLAVDEAGEYVVNALLLDTIGPNLLGYNMTQTFLAAGAQSVTLGYSTVAMQALGSDGPYVALIDVYSVDGFPLDSGMHFTGAYSVSQFDPLPAVFAPPHWDRGVDRDVPPDGLYNVLEATVNVSVLEAGTYAVEGQLLDSTGVTPLGQDVFIGSLAAGPQSMVLGFSGTAIRAAGIDGPYMLNLTLYAVAGMFPVPIDMDTHNTSAYLWTEFQSVVPAMLNGTVRDRTTGFGIDGAQVTAFDYANEQVMYATTDGSGGYSLPLYEGDWVVLFDYWDNNAELQRVTILGNTTLDADLWPYVPASTTVDVTMPTWNDASVSYDTVIESDNRTFRIQFDWEFGNRDQALTQPEFDVILALLGFVPPTLPAQTVDSFLVDGMPYDLVPGTDVFQFQNIPGPIDSTVPPGLALSASYTNASIAPAGSHIIDMWVDYDQDPEVFVYGVNLPAGYVLTGYTAPPIVQVAGVGTGVATVNPGLDPNPFDAVIGTWIQLTVSILDTTDPVVVSASAVPNPSLLTQPVTVTAVATDDIGIASVRLEVRDSVGTVVLNATMTDMGADTYETIYTPPAVGTYDFTVTATDNGGNTATRTGSFDVIERNAPVVVGASATPDPQGTGLPVLFAATVTDDTSVAAVAVEVRNAGGTLVGNYTMAFNATSGDYEVSQSFAAPGDLTFTVWALDPFGNVGSASGTVTIEDRTVPTADAGLDRTVMAGTAVTFDGTGSADNDRIAGYWWNFTDGGAQSLTGATPAYTFDTPGTYTVTLTVVDPAGNSDTDLVTIIVTAAVGTVEGTVTGTASAPVEGATVRLLDGATEVDTATTDADGGYSFAGVPPGDYTVSVTATGYVAATEDVTVVAGQTATADVQLTATSAGIGGLPSWAWILLIVVIVAAAALAVLLRRRRKPAMAPPSEPSAPAAPPPEASPPEAPAAPPAAPPAPEAPPPPPS